MKILHCDSCHVEVNDYAHWYNDAEPRTMYELSCIHEYQGNTYQGLILCQDCIREMLYGDKHISGKDGE